MSASLIARLAAAFSILFAATAQATIFRINENGVILAQSQADFLAGANTGILGQIDRYGNDAGFFYDPIADLYYHVNENGVIFAQSFADFLAGANTGILGQVDRYGNDADFFYVSDNPADVPLPSPVVLLFAGLAARRVLSWRRRHAPLSRGSPSAPRWDGHC